MESQNYKKIAFLGQKGSYSHQACLKAYPKIAPFPCASFDDVFTAVRDKDADLAMIPVDNTIAGRVADVHSLLPSAGLYIIGETFLPIRHSLLGTKGASLQTGKTVHSHIHALPQCRDIIRTHNLEKIVHADTASAAKSVADMKDPSQLAIASALAADMYDLEILQDDVQDKDHNTTRFLILSRDIKIPPLDKTSKIITTFFFHVRNIPAALYKSLGGFATNGLNLAKLESYVDENFQAAQFYCDVEGHAESDAFKLALEELDFYASHHKVLGVYEADKFRYTKAC